MHYAHFFLRIMRSSITGCTRKVVSIEEFKNRKYRYQMSEYSVEIERLVEYLRSFIKGLQQNVGVIEEDLRMLDEEIRLKVL